MPVTHVLRILLATGTPVQYLFQSNSNTESQNHRMLATPGKHYCFLTNTIFCFVNDIAMVK